MVRQARIAAGLGGDSVEREAILEILPITICTRLDEPGRPPPPDGSVGQRSQDKRGLHAHRSHAYPSSPAHREAAIMDCFAISNSAKSSPKLKVEMNSDMVNPIPPSKPIPKM